MTSITEECDVAHKVPLIHRLELKTRAAISTVPQLEWLRLPRSPALGA